MFHNIHDSCAIWMVPMMFEKWYTHTLPRSIAYVVQLYISHNKYIIIYNGRATFCTCKNVYINVYDVFMYYVELCYFISYYDMQ